MGGVGEFHNQAKNGSPLWKYSPEHKKSMCFPKLDIFTYSITLNEA